MKKSVSFCLLSILFAIFALMPKVSQGQEDCTSCLWLENQDPAVQEFERTTLEKPVMGETDLYRIFFTTDCVNPNAKISLEWEIFRNGVLLDGSSNITDLNEYADIKLKSMYNRINNGFLTLPLPEGICPTINTPIGNEVKSYPGAIRVFQGITLGGAYSLDFFYLNYFQATENYLEITWKQAWLWEGCQIVLKVVERTNGTDYPSFYYNDDQNLNIGGHQSIRGRVLATDTLQKLHRGEKYDEVCFEDLAYEFGWPTQYFNYSDTLFTVDVPFYNPECLNRIDSVVELTLLAFPKLEAPEFAPYFFCPNGGDTTLVATITQVSRLGEIFMQWRVGEEGEWTETAPVHNIGEPGVYNYYVRSGLTAGATTCYGEATLFEVTVFEPPVRIPELDNLVEYCINAEATPLVVTPSEDCFIEWLIDGEWTILDEYPTPATTEAGTETYLVRQTKYFTDDLTCSSSPADTITVNVFAYPVVTIELSSNPVCVDSELILTAVVEDENAEMEYVWNFGDPAKEGAQVTDIAKLDFTYYSVTATEIHAEISCASTSDTNITVNPKPVITFENTTSCHGTAFEARPIIPEDVVFAWVGGYDIEFDTVLLNNTNAPITYSFNYTAQDTSVTPNCISEAVLEVTVYPLPIPEITPDSIRVCEYEIFELAVADTKEYEDETLDATTFEWLNEEITDGVGSFSAAGTYNVIVEATNAYGCVAFDTIVATVQPLPEIAVTSDKEENTMCEFETATISVSGDYDFVWSANAGEVGNVNEFTVSPEPGIHTYYVTATDKEGELVCSIVDSITITVNELPKFEFFAEPTEICFNETSTLSIVQENEDDELTVVWGTTDGTNVFGPIEGGLHTVYVTVTNDVTSCERVDSVQIKVNPRPSVTYTYAPEVNQRNFKICSGTHVEVLANAPGEYMTYNWLLNTDEGPLLDVRPENADQEPLTKYYHIEITDANPAYDHACVLKDSVYLIVFAKPAPMIQAETDVICADDSVELYLSTAYTSYKWSTGEETATIFAKENKTYRVTVTNEAGCEGIDEFHVITLPVPEIVINASATTICSGEAVVLTPVEQNGATTTYTWDYTDGRTSNAGVLTTNSINNESGEPMKVTFTVIGVLDNGCDTEISIEVTVNPRPDAAIVSNKNVICPGDSVKLIAQDNNTYVEIDNVPVYRWSSNTGFTNEDSIYVKPVAGLTEYRLTVTNSYNCSHWVPKFVDVHPIPEVTIEGDREICAGEQVNTLTATVSPDENVTYLWSNGETTAEINAVVAGEYSVTVTTNEHNCAAASETVNLIVNENPIDSIVGGDAVCLGSNIEFSVHPGGTDKNYKWRLDGDTTVISVLPTLNVQALTPGTYRYTVVVENNTNGCMVTLAKTITVNDLPAPELGIIANGFCVTQEINLSSTADGTDLEYTWTVTDVTLDDPNAPEVAFIPENIGEYTVALTIFDTVTRCSNRAELAIDVKSLPAYELDNEAVVCVGNSTTLEVYPVNNNRYYYFWNGDGQQLDPTFTVTPEEKTTYFVDIKTEEGCIVTDSVVVDVREKPVFTKVEDKNICLGASADLVITDYTEDTRFFWSTGGRGDSIRVTPRVTTIYVVSADYADVGNCGVFDTIIVNVERPIAIEVVNTVSMCLNAPKTVTIEDPVDGATYTWTGFGDEPTTGTSITLEYGIPGEYTLTVSAVTALGCEAISADVVVTVHNTPGANIETDPVNVCAGNEVTLTVPAEFEAYSWVGFDPAETGQSVTFIPAASGTFTCAIEDENGCPSAVEFEVTVLPLPLVDYRFNKNDTICHDEDLEITAYPVVEGSNYTYQWLEAEAGTILNTTGVNYNHSDRPVYYGIVVTDTASLPNCVLHDSVLVIVKPAPTPIITADATTICYDGVAALDAGAGFASYEWSTGEETQSIEVLGEDGTKTYTVIVTDEIGCTGSATKEITVNAKPTLVLEVEDNEICPNEEVTITATANADYSYVWSASSLSTRTNVFISRDFPNNSDTPLYTTIYLTITDNSNELACTVTDSVILTINPAPIAAINRDSVVCLGSGTYLTARDNNNLPSNPNYGVSTFFWNEGVPAEHQTDVTIYYEPTTFGTKTFKMTATNSFGCSNTTVATIKVDTIAAIELINPVACYGAPVLVELAKTYSEIVWKNSAGDSVANGQTIELLVSEVEAENTYTVEVKTGNCSATKEFTISQYGKVTDILTDRNATVCANELPYEVAAIEGFDSYAWYNITEGASDVEVSDSRVLEADEAGMYELRVIDEFGCPGVDTFTLTVNSLPVVSTDLQMIKICADATIVDVTGAFAFGDNVDRMLVSYDDYSTIIATFRNPEENDNLYFITPTPMEDTTVLFQFFTTEGCVKEIKIPLTIIALPTPTAIDDYIYYCESSDGGVTIGFEEEEYTYIWESESNVGGNPLWVIPEEDTWYKATISLSEAPYCSVIDSIYVDVVADPTFTIEGDQVEFCLNSTAVFNVNGNADTYVWTVNGGPVVTNADGSYTLPTNVAGTYEISVTGTITNGGCTATETETITVREQINLEGATLPSQCYDPNGNLFVFTCDDEYPGYFWNDIPESGREYSYTFNGVGNYTVTLYVRDNLGCHSDTVNFYATVNPLPTADIDLDAANYCVYDEITASTDQGEEYSYEWNLSVENSFEVILDIAELGIENDDTLKLTVTNEFGCTASDYAVLVINETPDLTIGDLGRFCENATATFTVPFDVNYEYSWDGGATFSTNTSHTVVGADVPAKEVHEVFFVVRNTITGCERRSVGTVLFDDRPYFDITLFNNPAAVIDSLEGVVGTELKYDVIVRNECGESECTPVAVQYKIYRNDTLVTTDNGVNRMDKYVSGNEAIYYDVNYRAGDIPSFLMPTGVNSSRGYWDMNSVGSIPSGERPPANQQHSRRQFYLGGGSGQSNAFDWFMLHFLIDRRVTVSFNNFIKPGVYRIEYTLIEVAPISGGNTYHIHQAAYTEDDHGCRINNEPAGDLVGGHYGEETPEFGEEIAFRTIILTIGGDPIVAPEPIEPVVPVAPVATPAVSAELSAYPNPVQSVLNLEVKNVDAGTATITINNMAGRVLEAFEAPIADADVTVITRYLQANYTDGTYIVVLRKGSVKVSEKIIIKK